MAPQIALDVIGKTGGGNRSRGDAFAFQFAAMLGDRRGATVSTADTENNRVSLLLNFGP
jgi:hypothetical protein